MFSSCAQPLNIQAKSIFGVSFGLLANFAGAQSRQGWHTTSAVPDQKYGQNFFWSCGIFR
jgi:hypothetical protein